MTVDTLSHTATRSTSAPRPGLRPACSFRTRAEGGIEQRVGGQRLVMLDVVGAMADKLCRVLDNPDLVGDILVGLDDRLDGQHPLDDPPRQQRGAGADDVGQPNARGPRCCRSGNEPGTARLA